MTVRDVMPRILRRDESLELAIEAVSGVCRDKFYLLSPWLEEKIAEYKTNAPKPWPAFTFLAGHRLDAKAMKGRAGFKGVYTAKEAYLGGNNMWVHVLFAGDGLHEAVKDYLLSMALSSQSCAYDVLRNSIFGIGVHAADLREVSINNTESAWDAAKGIPGGLRALVSGRARRLNYIPVL